MEDHLKLNFSRKEDGTISVGMSIDGFSPNEVRELMFQAITDFTNDFNSKND
jgi:hypothetical protein